jgi:hypothetical protein
MSWPPPALPPEGWTDPPSKYEKKDFVDQMKALYQAELDAIAARTQAEVDREAKEEDEDWQLRKADWDSEIALYKAIHDARVEVAKGAIARGQAGAEFVRNAAASIVTLYTGILGLVFGLAEGAKPLPGTAVVPAIFLGFALASAAFYVAFLTRAPSVDPPKPSSLLRVVAERRLNVFVDWVSHLALSRVFWLHAAVIALSFGVLFLPAVFTSFAESTIWFWFWIAVTLTVVIPYTTASYAAPVPSPGGTEPPTSGGGDAAVPPVRSVGGGHQSSDP